MLSRLAADENFNARILAGLIRRLATVSALTVEQAGLRRADDPQVLEWASREGRVLLSHDAATMPRFAYERVDAGLPTPGLILVPDRMSIGAALDDLLLIVQVMDPEEMRDRVIVRLPL